MNVVRSLVIPTVISLIVHVVLVGLIGFAWVQFFLSHALISREFAGQDALYLQTYQSQIEGAALQIALQSAGISLACTVIWFVRCLTAPRIPGEMAKHIGWWLLLMVLGLILANVMGYFTVTSANIPQIMDRSAMIWHIVAFEILFLLVYWIASILSTEKALRVAVPLASVLP